MKRKPNILKIIYLVLLLILILVLNFYLLNNLKAEDTADSGIVEEIVPDTSSSSPTSSSNSNLQPENSSTMTNTETVEESSSEKFQFINGYTTNIKKPFALRDPFKKPMTGTGAQKKDSKGKKFNSDIFAKVEAIESRPLSDIKVVGVLLGSNRRAMAKIVGGGGKASGETYILKEGMKLGPDKAEIKAILPGGVVLVEKIKNVYDQIEYIETVIPITTLE